jgi:hypothetical protein
LLEADYLRWREMTKRAAAKRAPLQPVRAGHRSLPNSMPNDDPACSRDPRRIAGSRGCSATHGPSLSSGADVLIKKAGVDAEPQSW